MTFTDEGRNVLGVAGKGYGPVDNLTIKYADGPIFYRANVSGVEPYQELATYTTEIHSHNTN